MNAPVGALAGRAALITGASRGLGFEIARHYLEAGASVLVCAREAAPLEESVQRLRPLASTGQLIAGLPADVARDGEGARLVEAALALFGRLDVLVSNAGIAGPGGPAESVNWQDWLQAVNVNLLGPVQLCRAALPHFKRVGYGKIIQVSGGGATNPLPMLSAYATSKAAVVRFMETLAEEVRAHHVDVNSLAPGLLDTRLLADFIAAGPEQMGAQRHEQLLAQQRSGGVPLATGAALAVFLGSSHSDGITGKLISAVWDPWRTLPRHLAQLQSTDVYTLRRIVPADRDLDWEEGT